MHTFDKPVQEQQPSLQESNALSAPSLTSGLRTATPPADGPDTRTLQRAANGQLNVLQLQRYQQIANSSPAVVAQRQKQQAITQAQSGGITNQTGLPDDLKAGVEQLSGVSMDDVNVHYNSDQPAQLQAHAFAQGADIHVAKGQEKHLPHEAWHVAQQKQGRVKATTQFKRVAINDDSALEREADVMGAKAAALGAESAGPKQLKRIDAPGQVAQLTQRQPLNLKCPKKDEYRSKMIELLKVKAHGMANNKMHVTGHAHSADIYTGLNINKVQARKYEDYQAFVRHLSKVLLFMDYGQIEVQSAIHRNSQTVVVASNKNTSAYQFTDNQTVLSLVNNIAADLKEKLHQWKTNPMEIVKQELIEKAIKAEEKKRNGTGKRGRKKKSNKTNQQPNNAPPIKVPPPKITKRHIEKGNAMILRSGHISDQYAKLLHDLKKFGDHKLRHTTKGNQGQHAETKIIQSFGPNTFDFIGGTRRPCLACFMYMHMVGENADHFNKHHGSFWDSQAAYESLVELKHSEFKDQWKSTTDDLHTIVDRIVNDMPWDQLPPLISKEYYQTIEAEDWGMTALDCDTASYYSNDYFQDSASDAEGSDLESEDESVICMGILDTAALNNNTNNDPNSNPTNSNAFSNLLPPAIDNTGMTTMTNNNNNNNNNYNQITAPTNFAQDAKADDNNNQAKWVKDINLPSGWYASLWDDDLADVYQPNSVKFGEIHISQLQGWVNKFFSPNTQQQSQQKTSPNNNNTVIATPATSMLNDTQNQNQNNNNGNLNNNFNNTQQTNVMANQPYKVKDHQLPRGWWAKEMSNGVMEVYDNTNMWRADVKFANWKQWYDDEFNFKQTQQQMMLDNDNGNDNSGNNNNASNNGNNNNQQSGNSNQVDNSQNNNTVTIDLINSPRVSYNGFVVVIQDNMAYVLSQAKNQQGMEVVEQMQASAFDRLYFSNTGQHIPGFGSPNNNNGTQNTITTVSNNNQNTNQNDNGDIAMPTLNTNNDINMPNTYAQNTLSNANNSNNNNDQVISLGNNLMARISGDFVTIYSPSNPQTNQMIPLQQFMTSYATPATNNNMDQNQQSGIVNNGSSNNNQNSNNQYSNNQNTNSQNNYNQYGNTQNTNIQNNYNQNDNNQYNNNNGGNFGTTTTNTNTNNNVPTNNPQQSTPTGEMHLGNNNWAVQYGQTVIIENRQTNQKLTSMSLSQFQTWLKQQQQQQGNQN